MLQLDAQLTWRRQFTNMAQYSNIQNSAKTLVHIVIHTSCYHTRRVPEAPILATGSTGSTYGSTGSTVAQVVQVAQVVHAHFVNIGARA